MRLNSESDGLLDTTMLIEGSRAAGENRTRILLENGRHCKRMRTVFFWLTLFQGYSLSDTNV